MAAHAKLPDNEILVGLRRQGWTYADIGREYGVTDAAVYQRLRQARAVTPRASHKDLIPWTVKREHTFAFPVQMLRLLSRKTKGEVLSPVRERMLNKWFNEVKDADVVIGYDPEMPPNPASPIVGGFYYSKRRESDGASIVRAAEPASKPKTG